MRRLSTSGKVVTAAMLLVLLLLALMLANTLRLPGLPANGAAPLPAPADMDAAARRLAAAIRIPTVSSGPEVRKVENNFPALHHLLESSFPLTHAALQREVVSGASLLYTWQGSDPSLPPLLLTAHLDTVPVEPGTEGQWRHGPFSGDIADGFVWGRGTLDMKHAVMATFEGVEHLLAQGYRPRRTILLAFGHDEEAGGAQGAARITDLLEQRHVQAWFSLDEGLALLDGFLPGARRPIAQIGLAEKGMMSLILKAKADGGHSSIPPPLTAVGRIGRALARVEQQPMPASLAGMAGAGLRAMAPALPFGERFAIANQWLLEPLIVRQLSAAPATSALIRTTTAPTMVGGGVKENVLPAEAHAVVNFRLAPGDTVAGVRSHTVEAIDDPAVQVGIYTGVGTGTEASSMADLNSPGYRLIADAVAKVAPQALVAPGLVVAATDSRHYGRVSANPFRFVPVRLTPADVARVHGTDERIGIANYGEMIVFYEELIRTSTGPR